jgi:Ca-activated chloride channel homolog
MSMLWPGFLLLLGLIPLLVGLYIWAQRRKRVAIRYSSLSLIRAALPRYSQVRRHLPFAFFLLALTSLIVTMARPVQIVTVPTGQATIILALDVSGSMRQRDVQPTRLGAAQNAAMSFIQSQKAGTQIGIVAFAGYAELIQPPTTDRNALQDAIASLTTARGTNIGDGMLKSLDTIAEIDKSIAPVPMDGSTDPQVTPVPKGAYVPHIIVLLTDGVPTTGPSPLEIAQEAADRGVRVYTIGFGTPNGQPDFPFGQGNPFGGGPGGFGGPGTQGGGGFGGFNRGIDEQMLKQVAEMTDGKYYTASSADELLNVFQSLPTYLIAKHEVMEISVAFAAIGALLVAVAIALSLRWHPLP